MNTPTYFVPSLLHGGPADEPPDESVHGFCGPEGPESPKQKKKEVIQPQREYTKMHACVHVRVRVFNLRDLFVCLFYSSFTSF